MTYTYFYAILCTERQSKERQLNNPRKAFVELRDRYRPLYDARVALHERLLEAKVPMIGHDFFGHDLPVAQTCLLIHEDKSACERAWVAALLHSLDRLMSPQEEEDTLTELLSLVSEKVMGTEVKKEIRLALRNHDKANGENDSLTQQILQDADRLANAQSIILIRAGQFTSTVPAVELGHLGFARHPESSYRNTRSTHDDLIGVLEWDPEGPEACAPFCLRLPKAIEFGRPHFAYIRDWIRRVQSDFAVLGLDPWPIE
ncbi:MAG: hypothetical protein AB201_03355 [Parcubacteria bacterium C7867-006]|nr:MAG: hypothetical protein AB201_03355 [Parcubacteria bacterium C7867-006]